MQIFVYSILLSLLLIMLCATYILFFLLFQSQESSSLTEFDFENILTVRYLFKTLSWTWVVSKGMGTVIYFANWLIYVNPIKHCIG